jgi:hypothetical protein
MSVITPFKQPGTDRQENASQGPAVGQIVAFDSAGRALVEYPGAAGEPCAARSILADHRQIAGMPLPLPVFLMFEDNNSRKPLIVGIINDSPFIAAPDAAAASNSIVKENQDVYVDGKKLVITAKDEILLKCGKSSILLRRDGKVVIKGENLISRSSLSNKIKGSSVSIN